ncbi:MAG: 23S rRNA (adenine(2503)-C(2))-methyltransferase RlmN [Gammaproteobacteria bacterium]|nr:23S rRNA (adenine(2503)-C(2))-methyltransferase RlmN [Gammaproteobacteria bacterium]
MEPATNLFDLGPAAMREYFAAAGERPYRATQMLKWMYHRGVTELGSMTDISKPLRQRLAETTRFALPEIVSEQVSADGTRKWLLRVDAQNSIESVFIPEPDRGTLCISSQVGCALDCSFCSTGKQGFSRNLDVAEIIGQLWLVNRRLGYFESRQRIVSNVVMMGMGEPLLNFDNVVQAMSLMIDDLGFGLAHKRVTLSTVGVVPGIDRLAETSQVSLAVSLHAPTDELRNLLVPINRRYPLAELLAACRRYAEATGGEPITFEYVMLAGINDSPAEARELGRLLRGLPAKVNLIPFNAFPQSGYTRSPMPAIDQFRDILREAGLVTITRRPRGEDIDAACGQLVGQVLPRAARLRRPRLEHHT